MAKITLTDFRKNVKTWKKEHSDYLTQREIPAQKLKETEDLRNKETAKAQRFLDKVKKSQNILVNKADKDLKDFDTKFKSVTEGKEFCYKEITEPFPLDHRIMLKDTSEGEGDPHFRSGDYTRIYTKDNLITKTSFIIKASIVHGQLTYSKYVRLEIQLTIVPAEGRSFKQRIQASCSVYKNISTVIMFGKIENKKYDYGIHPQTSSMLSSNIFDQYYKKEFTSFLRIKC